MQWEERFWGEKKRFKVYWGETRMGNKGNKVFSINWCLVRLKCVLDHCSLPYTLIKSYFCLHLDRLFWVVLLDATELSTGLATEERDCKPPGSNAAPLQLGPATRSAKHLKVATRAIHFFMCKCTHIYVDLYVAALLMCVASVWALCPCTHPLGAAAQLCYREKLNIGTYSSLTAMGLPDWADCSTLICNVLPKELYFV